MGSSWIWLLIIAAVMAYLLFTGPRTDTEDRHSHAVDARRFGDPLASEIDWHPMRWWGRNWKGAVHCGYQLVELKPDRLAFRGAASKSTVRWYSIAGIFFFGFTSYIGGVTGALSVGLIIAFSYLSYVVQTGKAAFTSFVFDRNTESYWRGREGPAARPCSTPQGRTGNIHALQLLAEFYSWDDQGYFHTYQLNLVLEDGARQHVTNTNDQHILRKDARRLADFLEVPVWDATGTSVRHCPVKRSGITHSKT